MGLTRKMGLRSVGFLSASVILILAQPGHAGPGRERMEGRVRARMEAFIHTVNENRPQEIYDYLLPSIRVLIDREGFVRNFARERSYPYLTPLYLYLEKLELNPDGSSGRAVCRVAARLPGQIRVFPIIFTDGDYFVNAFREIADGSFAEKFDRLPIFSDG